MTNFQLPCIVEGIVFTARNRRAKVRGTRPSVPGRHHCLAWRSDIESKGASAAEWTKFIPQCDATFGCIWQDLYVVARFTQLTWDRPARRPGKRHANSIVRLTLREQNPEQSERCQSRTGLSSGASASHPRGYRRWLAGQASARSGRSMTSEPSRRWSRQPLRTAHEEHETHNFRSHVRLTS